MVEDQIMHALRRGLHHLHLTGGLTDTSLSSTSNFDLRSNINLRKESLGVDREISGRQVEMWRHGLRPTYQKVQRTGWSKTIRIKNARLVLRTPLVG